MNLQLRGRAAVRDTVLWSIQRGLIYTLVAIIAIMAWSLSGGGLVQ